MTGNYNSRRVITSIVESWYADYGKGDKEVHAISGDPAKYIANVAAQTAVQDLLKAAKWHGYKDYPRIITLDCQKLKIADVSTQVDIYVYDPVSDKYYSHNPKNVRTNGVKTKQEFSDFLKTVDSTANPATYGKYFISKEDQEKAAEYDVKMPFKVEPDRKTVWYSTEVLINDLNMHTWNEKYGGSVDALADAILYKMDNVKAPKGVCGDGEMTYSELFRKCNWANIEFSTVSGEWDNIHKRKSTRCCIVGLIDNTELGDFISRVNARADMPEVQMAAKVKYKQAKDAYDKMVEKARAERAYAAAHSSQFLHFGTNSTGGISEDFFAMCRADQEARMQSTDTGRCQQSSLSDKYRFTWSIDSSD